MIWVKPRQRDQSLAIQKYKKLRNAKSGKNLLSPHSLKLDRLGKVFVSFLETEMFSFFWKKNGDWIFFFSIRLSLTSVMARRISFYLRDLFFSFKSLCWNLIELSFNNIWLRITRGFKTGNYFSVISGINSKVSMKIGFIQIDGCKI